MLLGLALSPVVGAGSGVVPAPLQIMARNGWPALRGVSTASDNNSVTRIKARNGARAVKNIRIWYAWIYLGDTAQELTNIGNGSIRGAIRKVASPSTKYEAGWNGVAAGAYLAATPGGLYRSDVIPGLELAAFEEIFADTIITNVAGDYRPGGQYYPSAGRSEGYGASGTLATAENYFNGTTAFPGVASGLAGYGPVAIEAEAADGSGSTTVLFQDAIGDGATDSSGGGGMADAWGARGYIARAFNTRGASLLRMGRAGGTLASGMPGASPIRSQLYAHFIGNGAGNLANQLAENSISATVIADYTAFLAAWKAVKTPARTIAFQPLVKSTSSNGWINDAGQTVQAIDSYSATIQSPYHRFSLRRWLQDQAAAGNLRLVDGLPAVVSATAPDKWKSDGSTANLVNADINHPNSNGQMLMQPIVEAAIDGGLVS